MVIDRTTLGRAIRPLERGGPPTIGAGDDGRMRSLWLTASGEARFKAAKAKWREAQREFEIAIAARDAAVCGRFTTQHLPFGKRSKLMRASFVTPGTRSSDQA
jgi:hypothetical protein